MSPLKMPSLGFSREVTDWCKSYLSSRKFQVNFHDRFFISADLQCGVPQFLSLCYLCYIHTIMPQAVDCEL